MFSRHLRAQRRDQQVVQGKDVVPTGHARDKAQYAVIQLAPLVQLAGGHMTGRQPIEEAARQPLREWMRNHEHRAGWKQPSLN